MKSLKVLSLGSFILSTLLSLICITASASVTAPDGYVVTKIFSDIDFESGEINQDDFLNYGWSTKGGYGISVVDDADKDSKVMKTHVTYETIKYNNSDVLISHGSWQINYPGYNMKNDVVKGHLIFEFDFKTENFNYNIRSMYVSSASPKDVYLVGPQIESGTGTITKMGGGSTGKKVIANKWHKFKFDFDIDANTVDFSFDDEILQDDFALNKDFDGFQYFNLPRCMAITFGKYGTIYIDNCKLYTIATSYPSYQYTYRFENEDGTLISSGTENCGHEIVAPSSIPQKAPTAKYTYTFAGWNGYTEGMKLLEDITFRATYTATINKYTYTFLDADGNEFCSKTDDYDAKIIIPESPPSKGLQYTFTGWEGYTNGMTLTENITFIPQYTLKPFYINVDGRSTPISVLYGDNYYISPTKKVPYTFDGYYTQPDGEGTKLTDKDGYSIKEFDFFENVSVYPYFSDINQNIIHLESETIEAEQGEENIHFDVALSLDKDVQSVILKIRYPVSMTLSKATSSIFDYIEKQSEESDETHTVTEILCLYSFDGDFIPIHEYLDLLNLKFDITKTALLGESVVEICSDSILVGEEDYSFDVIKNHSITINPKLAERIIISGTSTISVTTKYTAEVYPDYTMDKSIEWSVNDSSVAIITSDGYLIPVKTGTVIITATSAANPSAFATKTIYVTKMAEISAIDSDKGFWIKDFVSSDYSHTIIVDSDANEITFTASYQGGILKINGSTVLSGRQKTLSLTDNVTVFTFERTNVSGCADSTYTLTVEKNDEIMIVKNLSSKAISAILNQNKITSFENATVLGAIYDEESKLIDVSIVNVTKTDKDFKIDFDKELENVQCKLLLWDSKLITKPLCAETLLTFE